MPKINTPKKAEDKVPVFTWGFKSSTAPLVGGVMFDYMAQLNQDGTVSCNCPGWRFVKKGQTRRCKHTDAVKGDVPSIMESWRDGKTFEIKEYSVSKTPTQSHVSVPAETTSTKKLKPNTDSKIRFNRVVEI